MTIVRCERLVKIHRVGASEVLALQGLDFTVDAGEMVAVIGPSGSGKSTLLNVLGGLIEPSAGRAVVADVDLSHAGSAELDTLRRNEIGFVWQDTKRNLLPHLTARQNVQMPMTFQRRRWVDRAKHETTLARATHLLDLVGMAHRADHTPVQMSGGEQQRVSIAVALANDPALLLADEPTGELDTETATELYRLLAELRDTTGLTQIMVSHDPTVARHVDRVVAVQDGQLASEFRARSVTKNDVDEVLIVDNLGRLRLDPEHRRQLGITDRVRAELVDDHIQVRAHSSEDER